MNHAEDAGSPVSSSYDPALDDYRLGAKAGGAWELEIVSKFLRTWGWVIVGIVMAVHIFMGYIVGVGYTGAAVTMVDRFAYPIVGLLISGVVLMLTFRPRVRVNSAGVEVRSFAATRFFPWHMVYGVSFPPKARTARLELPGYDYVALWALNTGDGQRALTALNEIRDLADKYMPEE